MTTIRQRADLHFHVEAKNLAEMVRVAHVIADPFYGYEEKVTNPEHDEWAAKTRQWEDDPDHPIKERDEWLEKNPEPAKKVDNTEPRPYLMNIEANVDGTPEEYAYARKFRGSVRCYIPWDRED